MAGFSEETLIQLDRYRLQFGKAYEFVVARLRALGYEPTGRPAKSSRAILDKLRRESIRLSQIQDIAGCRIVVPDVRTQDKVCRKLAEVFPGAQVVDRRSKPSHSYRAVHVVAVADELKVEIQVRTELQQHWAELSEKLADRFGLDVKYGHGPDQVREALSVSSESGAALERLEVAILELDSQIAHSGRVDSGAVELLTRTQASLDDGRRELRDNLHELNRLFDED